MNDLVRISCHRFIAGAVIDPYTRKIKRCAPIIYWMKRNGFDLSKIELVCKQKRWRFEQL